MFKNISFQILQHVIVLKSSYWRFKYTHAYMHDLSGACGVAAYVEHYKWVSVRLDEGQDVWACATNYVYNKANDKFQYSTNVCVLQISIPPDSKTNAILICPAGLQTVQKKMQTDFLFVLG